MNLPALLFGTASAALIGGVVHLWRGGGLGQLFLYLLSAIIGFWTGHIIGGLVGWNFGQLGSMNYLFGILGSCVLVFIAYWLSELASPEGDLE